MIYKLTLTNEDCEVLDTYEIDTEEIDLRLYGVSLWAEIKDEIERAEKREE